MFRYYHAVMAGVGTDQIDVVFPDFPCCVTVAKTLEEAHCRAAEVLAFHLQSMVDEGDPIPDGGDERALLELVKECEEEGYHLVIASVGIEIPEGEAKDINDILPKEVIGYEEDAF
ncbi:MAG TPA: type II toxin-antitoxin system HicB family antitoxin [Candidatus Hydrogenedentes bacterium]|nr:type II toxin-antitoxin system HicB family antitoxin [Candidatus Hydrogenedentota bacterium]